MFLNFLFFFIKIEMPTVKDLKNSQKKEVCVVIVN